MIKWSQPYERSDTLYEPGFFDDPWRPIACKHCEEDFSLHWQTADGKVWCCRNVDSSALSAAPDQ